MLKVFTLTLITDLSPYEKVLS